MSTNAATAVFTVHNASLTPAVDYEVTVTAEIADEGTDMEGLRVTVAYDGFPATVVVPVFERPERVIRRAVRHLASVLIGCEVANSGSAMRLALRLEHALYK